MELHEILIEKEKRLESVPDKLATRTESVQKKILKELISELDSLERENGRIKMTNKNMNTINKIAAYITDFIFEQTEYQAALIAFSKEFNIQAGLTQDFFIALQGDFKDKEIYRNNIKLSQKQSIELLAKAGVNQIFINPMKDILQASITSGATYADAIEALTIFVIGNKNKEGTLLSHVKQVAYDGFAFSDRQYVKMISKDLEYEFYQYFGGLVRDSRCFCIQRSNGIFHEKEIEYWGETPSLWDKKPGCDKGGGRIPSTNASTIWTYAGGYHCLHQIIPVLLSAVPKKVINKAVKEGYYVE